MANKADRSTKNGRWRGPFMKVRRSAGEDLREKGL